jgi:hypothetical protein
MDTSLQEVAQRLRQLAALSPAGSGELKTWNAAAKEFKDWLSARPDRLVDQVPHFVWHYLDDADIRSRDEVYRRNQERELAAVLATLEGGGHAA